MKSSIAAVIILLTAFNLTAADNNEIKKKLIIKNLETSNRVTTRTFLGVSTTAVGESLASPLQLKANHGLMVNKVIEGSAAEKAGIKKHDIILKINDSDVDGSKSLFELIQLFKPQDKVSLKLLRTGKEITIDAVLGERKEPNATVIFASPDPDNPNSFLFDIEIDELMDGLKDLEVDIKGLEDVINKQKNNHQAHKDKMKHMQKLFEELAKNPNIPDHIQFDGKRRSVIRMSDGDHDIEINTVGDHKTLKVKDNTGKMIFEGPINTDAEKALIPAELKGKIDKIDTKGNTINFNFNIDIRK